MLGFLVGLYDTWLSGRIEGISEVATGAVGLAAYVGWLASMLFGLVATGTTALVARHRGAGEPVEANRIMNRSLALAAVAGGGVYALIYAVAPWMARLLEIAARKREAALKAREASREERRRKREETTAELPIILLTAKSEEDNKTLGLEAGAWQEKGYPKVALVDATRHVYQNLMLFTFDPSVSVSSCQWRVR